MFLILSKILHFLTTPIVWIGLLMVFAIFVKKKKIKRISLLLAIGILYLFSNAALFRLATSQYTLAENIKIKKEHYSAGIVLGGMSRYNRAADQITFMKAGDRLAQAIHLYHTGIIDKIIISGGSGNPFANSEKEADILQNYLLDIHIPTSDVIIENQSRNTHENALYTAKLIKENDITGSFVLISSALHLKRAKKCFEAYGIKADTYAANYENGMPLKISDYYMPKAEILKNWEYFLHEIIGIGVYKLMGYID